MNNRCTLCGYDEAAHQDIKARSATKMTAHLAPGKHPFQPADEGELFIMNNVHALHSDCVMCRTEQDNMEPAQAVLVVLLMLARHTPEEIVKELCFAHRRIYTEKLESFKSEVIIHHE